MNFFRIRFKYSWRKLVITSIFVFGFYTKLKFTNRDVKFEKNPVPIGQNENKITVAFAGRAGNQMFQYASLIGIAKTNNRTPVLLENTELWHMFDLPVSTAYLAKKGQLKTIREEHAAVYSRKFENIKSDQDVYLQRYLQSWKYFENVKSDLINKHFKLRESIIDKSRPFVDNIKKNYVNTGTVFVGVHVRRGDIVRERKPVGHIPAPLSYFYRAMNYFRQRHDKIVFVMISNSMMWCKDNLDDSSNVLHVETGDPYIDFAILHEMDHLILSVGTFGWWAGYLSRGTVIFYKGYPKANTTMSIEMKQSDFIPKQWVGF